MSFSDETVISVNNVSKRYEMYSQPRDRLLQFLPFHQRQYFKEFWALKSVSFSVQKGETIGILGRNGSGKSTLLQIIAGTLTPTTGKIHTRGVMAALLELGSGFNPEFTGRENIYLNGTILGFSKAQMDECFDKIVAFADIGEHLDQPLKKYSSGMSVRLAFAVQACVSPQILIVDEALSVGDEKFQRKCFDYIKGLREAGCSILLVTHSTATVEKFCQRGLLLHNGEVHGIGSAKEIVDQYHALLYSDEKAYLRYLSTAQHSTAQHLNSKATHPIKSNHTTFPTELENKTKLTDLRAVITGWNVVDSYGNPSEQYKTGETLTVCFYVDILSQIDEIQAGILIRTVEGVTAFGTSTLYHKKNHINAQQGSQLQFNFELQANLCAGSYFITLAVAEAISHGDMLYLDKKTDVIIIKIHQPRVLASGIAMLDATVEVSEL